MLDKPITLVDIETTGMSSYRSAITEIAILKFHGQEILDEFHTLVNPGQSIDRHITLLTGIDDNMVADAPYFDEIADKVYELFEDSYFMAHNVLFDFSFIKRQMRSLGFNFTPRLLCSVKLSRSLYPGERSHSLANIIKRHSIATPSRHRALDDARAVYDFIHLAATEKGESTVVDALKSQLKYKSLPSNLDQKLLCDIKNEIGVYIFKDKRGTPVYVGKSVNLRNRILNHFSQSTKLSKELKISSTIHSIETIKTDSELEALLLESKLVKELLPVYNRKLRRVKTHTLLKVKLNENGYKEIFLESGNISDADNLDEIYGVYSSRRKAFAALESIKEEHSLCNKLLGLEHMKGSCFLYRLGKCKGACAGAEKPEIYNLRFDMAFKANRLKSWPFKGPIKLKVSEASAIIVNNWKILGKYTGEDFSENNFSKNFDLDNYKILESFIRTNPKLVLK